MAYQHKPIDGRENRPRSSARTVLAGRVLAIGVLTAMAVYALTGVDLILSRPAAARAPGVVEVRRPVAPTPVDLLAFAARDGYWAFPGGYWTIAQSSVDASNADFFWHDLAIHPAGPWVADPDLTFDDLLPPLRVGDGHPLSIGGLRIYRLKSGLAEFGLATAVLNKVERVVAGGALIRSDASSCIAFELRPSLISKTRRGNAAGLLSNEERGGRRCLALRYTADGRCIAEVVRQTYDERAPSGLRKWGGDVLSPEGRGTSEVYLRQLSRGDAFEWRVAQGSSELSLFVSAVAAHAR